MRRGAEVQRLRGTGAHGKKDNTNYCKDEIKKMFYIILVLKSTLKFF